MRIAMSADHAGYEHGATLGTQWLGAHPFLTLTLFIAMFERDHEQRIEALREACTEDIEFFNLRSDDGLIELREDRAGGRMAAADA